MGPWAAPPAGLEDDFKLSAATQDYYKVFGATSLACVMPAHWKKAAGGEACDEEGVYQGFSRYTIQPERNERAQSLMSTMRLGENTRSNGGRFLGYQSILSNYVRGAAQRPTPLGGQAMVFNDSDKRLSLIAEGTGEMPQNVGC